MARSSDVEYKMRMTQDLKEKIVESAKKLNRSMNADIVARLEKTFELNHLYSGMGLPPYIKPEVYEIGLSDLNLKNIENRTDSKVFLKNHTLDNISTEDLMKELAKRLDGFSVVANKK